MTTLTLTLHQARTLGRTPLGADFLIHAISCTQGQTAQKRKGWFYKSLSDWKTTAGVGRTAVNNTVKRLIQTGILSTYSERDYGRIYGGIRRWYKVNIDVLQKALDALEQPAKNTLRKVTQVATQVTTEVKCSARALYDNAVSMGKIFTGQPKTPTTSASYPQAACTDIPAAFSDYVNNQGGKLKELFTRFGLNSNYVQKVLKEFTNTQNKQARYPGDITYPMNLNHHAWQEWLDYRRYERGWVYKTAKSEHTAITEFLSRCPSYDNQAAWIASSIAAQHKSICPPPYTPSTRMNDEEIKRYLDPHQPERYVFNFDDDDESPLPTYNTQDNLIKRG